MIGRDGRPLESTGAAIVIAQLDARGARGPAIPEQRRRADSPKVSALRASIPEPMTRAERFAAWLLDSGKPASAVSKLPAEHCYKCNSAPCQNPAAHRTHKNGRDRRG